ncbi:MAG: M56 family metallopeptidase, partial [Balneolaceae bacterium]
MIELAEFSGQVTAVLQVIWIPLLIWTLFAFILQIVLKYTENLHAHIHYHIRLALLLALPAGLITAGLFELSGWLQYQSADEAATYKLFIIQTPLELTVTASEYENTNLFNTANLLVFGTLILITGSVFLITGYIYSRYLLNRLTASCSLKSIHSFRAVDIKNKRLGTLSTHSVKLAITEMPVIPFTYGFKNPIIVLPKFLLQDEESLNMVLRHELMHIRHNDYLLHHVLVIIRALFWFHPLVHLLFREIIDYREIRIDSHVLEDNEISKKRYASLLLELLPFQNFEKSAAIYMARESSNLKKRINMIKMNNFRKIPKKTSLTAFASILILFSLFMACTDLQNHNILDDEDINMMADFDVQGDRGHHEIILFMSSPDQRERNNEKLQQLNQIHPDDILSIDVYKD